MAAANELQLWAGDESRASAMADLAINEVLRIEAKYSRYRDDSVITQINRAAGKKAVTIDAIQKFVSEYYQLKLTDLKSRNNSKSVAMPRQVAMYLCKSLTHASLPEIGRSFGGKHHSTVIHSIKKVDAMRKQDGHFNTLLNSFLESFR